MRSSKRLSSLSLSNGSRDIPQDEESFQYFADKNFQGGQQGHFSRKDLRQALLSSTPDKEKQAALAIWKVILRFMGDTTDFRGGMTNTNQQNPGSVMARLYVKLDLRESERHRRRRHKMAPPGPTEDEHEARIEEVNRHMTRGGTMRRLKATLTRRLFRDEQQSVLHTSPLDESLHTPLDQLHFIIGYGILQPCLRDEIYCQTCRQLVKNPFKSSTARGWLLLSLLAGCFPPSVTILKYVIRFLEDGPPLYTVTCKRNLQRTLQNGPRCQPAAFIELEAGLNKRLLEVSVTLMDGTMHTMQLDAATTSRELCAKLAEFIGLRDQFGFSIYIAMYNKVASLGNGSDHILDSISQCEQIYRETENKEGPAPWRLFYRKEMFSPWENASHDPVAAGLVFAQVARGIMLGEYKCDSDQQLAVLAAQQYYIEYGSDISEDGLTALLPSYVPQDKLQGDDMLKMWRRAVIKAHKKLLDVSDWQRVPQEKVKQEVVSAARARWPAAFSRHYDVVKEEGPDWGPDDLTAAVSCAGVYVLAAGSLVAEIPFSDIVDVSDGGGRTGGPSDIMMLILVSGAAIKLSSADGDDMRHLVSFMLNGLKQRSTYSVVVQACAGPADGMLVAEEGDLVVLGRQAGLEALTSVTCVGRNERTGLAGTIHTDYIYILPTLTRPSENTMKLFKSHTHQVPRQGEANTSMA